MRLFMTFCGLFTLLMVLACNEAAKPAPTGSEVAGSDFDEFMRRVQAQDTCQELFEFRNALDPHSPYHGRINTELRAIGCLSSGSTRTDHQPTNDGDFTVKEFRIYIDVVNTPFSISEDQAIKNTSQRFGVTANEARTIIEKVLRELTTKGWFGALEAMIRHASDWDGERH